MELYPHDDNGYRFLYTAGMTGSTVLSSAWLQHSGDWLPFVVALVWTAFLMWDLYLADWLFPQFQDENKEVRNEAIAMDWIAGTKDRDIKDLRRQITRLGDDLKDVKKENDRLRRVKRKEEEVDDALPTPVSVSLEEEE